MQQPRVCQDVRPCCCMNLSSVLNQIVSLHISQCEAHEFLSLLMCRYGRHSDSIDVTRKCCGRCSSVLVKLGQFRKVPIAALLSVFFCTCNCRRLNYTLCRRTAPRPRPEKLQRSAFTSNSTLRRPKTPTLKRHTSN